MARQCGVPVMFVAALMPAAICLAAVHGFYKHD